VNPLVANYGVKEAPWLLMFSRGELVLSENPTGPRNGGMGFASRLRYMAFAKPRVLVLEPAPSVSAMQSAAASAAYGDSAKPVNNFQLQLQTQEVLRRARFDFDLAITTVDATRMALSAQPSYGILLCSSEVGPTVFSEIASRLKERNPKALALICHDQKCLGPLDESMQTLLKADAPVAADVLYRPLTKSSFERALVGNPDTRVNFPTCGMVKEDLLELIRKKLGGT